MAYTVVFTKRHFYDSTLEGIIVDVELSTGGEVPIRLRAKIDTGASDCLCGRQYARLSGLPIEAGYPRTFLTATGTFKAYGHEVSIRVLGIEFTSVLYFFADDAIEKNVLGRRSWLDRVRIGIVDYDSTLYLSPHNEA